MFVQLWTVPFQPAVDARWMEREAAEEFGSIKINANVIPEWAERVPVLAPKNAKREINQGNHNFKISGHRHIKLVATKNLWRDTESIVILLNNTAHNPSIQNTTSSYSQLYNENKGTSKWRPTFMGHDFLSALRAAAIS